MRGLLRSRGAMKKYIKSWGQNTLSFFDATFSRVAIFSSIVAFAGFRFADIPYSDWVLIGFGVYIALGIVVSKPKYIAPPNPNSRIPIEHVNEQIANSMGIGLIGLASSGKTTFLDATVSRAYDGKETARPYGQLVRIPDTEPPQQVMLVDSVGAKNHIQFTVQAMSVRILFFIDHNPEGAAEEISAGRVSEHVELAKQVSHAAIDQNLIIDKIVIVANKSDQWQTSDDSSRGMLSLANQVRDIFKAASPYRDVEVFLPFSNMSASDVATLLKAISN
ncbi:MAG: hypothetical protein COA41_07840 [Sphingopyxis sp.]|nr:MAG: hypothetical protein COA41_07840 [Sphingopyxis sp.]